MSDLDFQDFLGLAYDPILVPKISISSTYNQMIIHVLFSIILYIHLLESLIENSLDTDT